MHVHQPYQYQPSFPSPASLHLSREMPYRGGGGGSEFGGATFGGGAGDFGGRPPLPSPLQRQNSFPERPWDEVPRLGMSTYEFGRRIPEPTHVPFEGRRGSFGGQSTSYINSSASTRDEPASSGPHYYPSLSEQGYSHQNRGPPAYGVQGAQPSPPYSPLSYNFGDTSSSTLSHSPPRPSSLNSLYPRYPPPTHHHFAPPPYPTNRAYSMPDISEPNSRDQIRDDETFVPQDQRPFKCDQCSHAFQRNHDLKRHRRIHLAVKPYSCRSCEKRFTRKDALKRHFLVKQHTGSTQIEEEFDAPPMVRGVDSVVNLLRRASATSDLSNGSSSSSSNTSGGNASTHRPSISSVFNPPPQYRFSPTLPAATPLDSDRTVTPLFSLQNPTPNRSEEAESTEFHSFY